MTALNFIPAIELQNNISKPQDINGCWQYDNTIRKSLKHLRSLGLVRRRYAKDVRGGSYSLKFTGNRRVRVALKSQSCHVYYHPSISVLPQSRIIMPARVNTIDIEPNTCK